MKPHSTPQIITYSLVTDPEPKGKALSNIMEGAAQVSHQIQMGTESAVSLSRDT